MKLWLDDIRPAPEGWWAAKTAEQAIRMLDTGMVDEMSFDHDLGESEDAHSVVCWIEKAVAVSPFEPPSVMVVHSDNPVGAARLRAAIESIRRIVKKRDGGLQEPG
jgi:hypothetical protein